VRARFEKKLPVAQAYDQFLFHGPRFQVMTALKGLSADAAAATVVPSAPRLVARRAGRAGPLGVRPGDHRRRSAMAIVWAREFLRDLPADPLRRVVRYVDQLPEQMTMSLEVVPLDDAGLVGPTSTTPTPPEW
jgi:hypothetical protein